MHSLLQVGLRLEGFGVATSLDLDLGGRVGELCHSPSSTHARVTSTPTGRKPPTAPSRCCASKPGATHTTTTFSTLLASSPPGAMSSAPDGPEAAEPHRERRDASLVSSAGRSCAQFGNDR